MIHALSPLRAFDSDDKKVVARKFLFIQIMPIETEAEIKRVIKGGRENTMVSSSQLDTGRNSMQTRESRERERD